MIDKFGLRGKHIAAADEHVSDLAVAAGERLLDDHDIDPASIDVVVYFGSKWKDYAVWQAAPWIAHRLGCENASRSSSTTSRTGRRWRSASAATTSSPSRSCAASSPSPPRASRTCSTTTNERSRFMFNFGDGAAAALIERDPAATRCSPRTRSPTGRCRCR